MSPVRKEVTVVSKRLTYISGIMWIDDAKSLLQPPRGVSVCLSAGYHLDFFPGGGGA